MQETLAGVLVGLAALVSFPVFGQAELIVSGVSTNACVESTVRDAYFRDYDITVVEDCVAGPFPALHQATLENVRIYFGEVVLLADSLASFHPSAADSTRLEKTTR